VGDGGGTKCRNWGELISSGCRRITYLEMHGLKIMMSELIVEEGNGQYIQQA